jgi:mono/diheme cytochrome c family protein
MKRSRFTTVALGVATLSALSSCRTENVAHRPDFSWNRMIVQPRYDPYGSSAFFADGKAMRTPPRGTEPFSRSRKDEALSEGAVADAPVDAFPLPVTLALVRRGRTQFEIICAACHGVAGDGNSVPARFMARRPPSLYEARTLELPLGRIYGVIRDGYGLMPAYRTHLSVRDRWAVVAYVRALARSRHALVANLPPYVAAELARNAP